MFIAEETSGANSLYELIYPPTASSIVQHLHLILARILPLGNLDPISAHSVPEMENIPSSIAPMAISNPLTGTCTLGLWVPGSHVRGTWDILSTCLSTIVICMCSAFHTDIPQTRPENRRLLFAMLQLGRWAILFLLLPEILPSIAFEQLQRAYIIFMTMKNVQVCEMCY